MGYNTFSYHKKIKATQFLLILCIAVPLTAAVRTYEVPTQPVHAPADAKRIFSTITHDALSNIKTEEQLGDCGVITALVVRPSENERKAINTVTVTKNGIVGDRRIGKALGTVPPDAVTLIRTDVSNILGGSPISGDNIHVEGLHIGEKYLKIGDLLVVTDPQTHEVKVIFLKTTIPHYGCWKFISRFGQNAYDLCNAEGSYEAGITTPAGLIHGPTQRLRGLRLMVLKEGIISLGDHVSIVTAEEKGALLHAHNLDVEHTKALESSKEIGEQYEKRQRARAELRKKHFKALATTNESKA